MFGKAINCVGIVIIAILFCFSASFCAAQTSTANDGTLLVNACGGLNNVASVCIYGQSKITNAVPTGYCYVNTANFRYGGDTLSCIYYLDKDLNVHTLTVTYGKYVGTTIIIAYGYISTTNYLDPTKKPTFGALIEGALAPYDNKVLYSTGWTDKNGNGPDSTDLLTEWPVLSGYINPLPLYTPKIIK